MNTHSTGHDQPALLARGAVVDYHGSRTDVHGRYVVVTVDEQRGRDAITDQDFPWFLLRKVRAASLTATGEHEILCTGCDHAEDWRRFAEPTACSVEGCCCDTHTGPPSSKQPQSGQRQEPGMSAPSLRLPTQ